MIVGLGIDLVDVERVRRSLERWGSRWEKKIFTEAERAACGKTPDPAPRFAARFAAKEALYKALSEPPHVFSPREIEIVSGEFGKPSVRPVGKCKQALEQFQPFHIHLSMTHERTMAAATVVIEKI